MTPKACLSAIGQGFKRPMYQSVPEVVNLIKVAIGAHTTGSIESVRTIESGVVEEHAVIERSETGKKLLFRVWPIFYRHDKVIEYKLYDNDPKLQDLIGRYLHVCAATNNAKLILK